MCRIVGVELKLLCLFLERSALVLDPLVEVANKQYNVAFEGEEAIGRVDGGIMILVLQAEALIELWVEADENYVLR